MRSTQGHDIDSDLANDAASRDRIIDVHTHALPMPLLEDLERRGYADLSGSADGVLLLHPAVSGVARGARIPLPADHYDVTRRLESMTQVGVDVQLVSAPPFVFGSMSDDPDLVLDLARRSNDALAHFVSADTDHMYALGTVPIGLPQAVTEAARCVDELGMAGLTMGTFGGACELDDPVNEDVWAFVTARRTFCFVHPSRASSPERLRDYYLVQLLGYPFETALASARLIFGGVLDRHDPNLCLAHGGGCLPSISPRLDTGWRRKAEARTIGNPPTDYLRRFSFDTAVFDSATLARLVHDVGHERLLLGTDMPFDLADVDAVRTIREIGMSREATRAILGGNACQRVPALAGQYSGPAAAGTVVAKHRWGRGGS